MTRPWPAQRRAAADEPDQRRAVHRRDAGAAGDLHGHRAADQRRGWSTCRASARRSQPPEAPIEVLDPHRPVDAAARARQGAGGRAQGDARRSCVDGGAAEAGRNRRAGGGDLRRQGRALRGGARGHGQAAAQPRCSASACWSSRAMARAPMLATRAPRPGRELLRPCSRSRCTSLLLAVLFFGVRWQHEAARAGDGRAVEPAPGRRAAARRAAAAAAARRAEAAAEPKPEPTPEPKVDTEARAASPTSRSSRRRRRRKKPRRRSARRRRPRRRSEDELGRRREQEREDKEVAEKRRRDEEQPRKRMQDQLARELAGAAPKAVRRPRRRVGRRSERRSPHGSSRSRRRSARTSSCRPTSQGNPEAEFDVVAAADRRGAEREARASRAATARSTTRGSARSCKSSPLPQPAEPEMFRRDLRLKFRPRD